MLEFSNLRSWGPCQMASGWNFTVMASPKEGGRGLLVEQFDPRQEVPAHGAKWIVLKVDEVRWLRDVLGEALAYLDRGEED